MRLRDEDLEWREVDGEILVLDRRASRYLSVPASGAALWRQLSEETTPAALAQRLVELYGIEPERARDDVERFLRWLQERDLLDS